MGFPSHEISLPSGWGCEDAREGEITFIRDNGRVRVRASRSDLMSRPPFDIPSCWKLVCQQHANTASTTVLIGYVGTRKAATETLVSAMNRINENRRAGDGEYPLNLDAVVEDISLRDKVPSADSHT